MPGQAKKNDKQRPILLCCAGPDRAAIAPVVEKASHLGRAWLVCGVEANTRRLERGVERYGGDAMYVLCRSRHLDGTLVAALEQQLRRRGVPANRVMVVDVDGGKSARLQGALEQRMSPRVGVSTPAGAIPPPPKVVPVPKLGAAVRSPRPLAKVRLVPRSEPAPANTVSSAPKPARPVVTEPSHAPRTGTKQKTDSVPLPVAEANLDLGLAAAGVENAVLPPHRAPRWLVPAAAAAVLFGLGGLAVAGSGDEAPSPSTVPVVAASPRAPAPAEASPAAKPSPSPASAPEKAALASPTVREAAKPMAEAEEESGLDGAQTFALELEGLRSRRLREVDGIVFTAVPLPRDIHYGRAEAYCRNLTLSGISDWRLPTAPEMGTIGQVVDLGRKPLWTATDGDPKEDSMLIYLGRQDEFGIRGRTWRGARALCVRSTSDA